MSNAISVDTDVDFTSYFLPRAAETPGLDDKVQAFSVKTVNEERRQITGVASAEIIDRDGEIVTLAALKAAIKDYMKNPVILAGHSHRLDDGRSPVVGKVVSYTFKGKELLITVEFAPTALGEEYWQLYRDKFQRAFSIGFRIFKSDPEVRDGKRVRVISEIELYEISCVAVPANPAALAKSFIGRKRLDREKQRIMNNDTLFCKLLDRFDQLSYEYWDPFGNIPENSDLWGKFSAAEVEILKEFEQSCAGWGFDGESYGENGGCGAFGGGSDAEGGDGLKSILGDSGAFYGEDDFGSENEPDYSGFFG